MPCGVADAMIICAAEATVVKVVVGSTETVGDIRMGVGVELAVTVSVGGRILVSVNVSVPVGVGDPVTSPVIVMVTVAVSCCNRLVGENSI